MSGKRTFNPDDYTAFKAEVGNEMRVKGQLPRHPVEGPLSMDVVFGTDGMWFQLRPVPGHMRAVHVTADVDNLSGGLMDALQDALVIRDDKQIVELHSWIDRRE